MASLAPQTLHLVPPVQTEDTHHAPEGDQGAGRGFNFRYILAVVRSNLKLILLIFVTIALLSVAITFATTPRYQASGDIQVNNTGGRFLKNQADAEESEAGSGNTFDTDRFLRTQVDVLKSRGIAERVAKKLNLVNSETFFASQGKKDALTKLNEAQRQNEVIRLLDKHLDVMLPKDSRLIKITYESNDAQFSADLVNTYISEFIQFNLEKRFDSSRYAREFLANQLVEVKGKLEESERNLNAYARSAGLIRMNVAPAGQALNTQLAAQQSGSVTTSSLVQLNNAANDAKARRIAAEARWNAINSTSKFSATEVMGNQGIQQLLNQRATVAATLEQDRARHLPDYPSVRAGEAQLASIDRQLDTNVKAIRNAVKAEYDAARQAEEELKAQVAGLKTQTLDEQDSTVRYGLLAREVDTNREVYDGLLQRYKELNASAGITVSNIIVIDRASVPLKPSSPDVGKNLLIGFVLAITVTALVIAAKDQLDDSVHIPEDVEAKLGMPLLGMVPKTSNLEPLELLSDPKSALSEAFNSMRSSLMFSTQNGMPRSMAITSAQPGEGKSTTSLALAIALARMGKKVLLIDADLRRPSLHRRVDFDNEVGLVTLLTSDKSIADVAQQHNVAGLSVVTSGPIPPSPTELLSGVRIREVLKIAREQFDVVLFDSPPVLGLADAPMLATLVEGVIFVAEADRSRYGALRGALSRLHAVNPVVLGGVLTKFDALKTGNRYTSYYGYDNYHYQYGYQADVRK
ncbi:GumC family protein [Novosphingobium umbonatum]|uniref:GumC family protein n=1 Tax=Novosphingobium umbonatum TaxID=1908524 RepID=UPI0013E3304D|nr:polysaccharide biosynthesis tyrosine autokinase [Novosphingobium umbonatum]